MNDALFERLLYEEESPTLDFKREQYRFVNASEQEKAELLKDLLGFVNAWRRSEAYILIGVQDVRGGRANVVGIPHADHLDDHSLQQFVNNLTSRPVHFQYEAFGFEGLQIGVIRIEEQPRPVFLKRDFGRLKRNEVYVRRGSSTDPTKPALPDEIARMGSHDEYRADVDVVAVFASIVRKEFAGTHLALEAEYCEMPIPEYIPNFEVQKAQNAWEIYARALESQRINSRYYEQRAAYEFETRLFRPIRLAISNAGQDVAVSVRAEIELLADPQVELKYDIPRVPERYVGTFGMPIDVPPLAGPGDVYITRDDDKIRITIDCGNLQPGRTVWSEVFYLSRRTSGQLRLTGQILADNLPRPKEVELTITCNVKQTRMSVKELVTLPDPG